MKKSEQILKRLESLHPKQIDLSLERTLNLLNKIGNPQKKLPPTIHVAGTNGKGSTIAFLRSIFEENKYKVQVYTSPHLINFNERIRINSKLISNELLISLLEECEFYNKKNPITFFEITTVAAYLGFSRIESDILLLETGLGGRFDATNVIPTTICSVITPISMDHMSFLGNSIKTITKEKVGIFKKNIPAVISKQNREAIKVIREESKKKKVKLYEYSKYWKISQINKAFFHLKIGNELLKIPMPNLFGNHQLYNSGTAMTVAKIQEQFSLQDELTFQGIKKTFWPARMQKIESGKLKSIIGQDFEIWLDGGHNEHASNMLLDNIKKWKEENLFLIFGMLSNKEPKEFLNKIINYFRSIYVIPIVNHSFFSTQQIKQIYKDKKDIIKPSLSVVETLKALKRDYKKGKIIICGSLYLAGDILKENESLID